MSESIPQHILVISGSSTKGTEDTMSAVPIRSMDTPSAQARPHLHDATNTRTIYRIDPAASRVEFTIGKRLFFVTHLLVTGRFSDVRGTISLDEHEPARSQAEVTIGAASVDTRMGKRDKHLRTADFFDVERHLTLTFTSRRIETIDPARGHFRVVGELTVRGVTREVQLDATTYIPAARDGSERRIKLTLTGPLNRRDFGMVWNNPLLTIPDDLTVRLQIEATAA
jgi:polyisoprenoid-binding protein YceI